jgi:pimeloyl-ACP methyl ester carboxylesterase
MEGFNRLERASSSPERAAQLMKAFSEIDASGDLGSIRCPTLVFHTRQDARIDFEEGRFIASGIDAARLVPLEGLNHFPLEGDAAYDLMLEAIGAFIPAAGKAVPRAP